MSVHGTAHARERRGRASQAEARLRLCEGVKNVPAGLGAPPVRSSPPLRNALPCAGASFTESYGSTPQLRFRARGWGLGQLFAHPGSTVRRSRRTETRSTSIAQCVEKGYGVVAHSEFPFALKRKEILRRATGRTTRTVLSVKAALLPRAGWVLRRPRSWGQEVSWMDRKYSRMFSAKPMPEFGRHHAGEA